MIIYKLNISLNIMLQVVIKNRFFLKGYRVNAVSLMLFNSSLFSYLGTPSLAQPDTIKALLDAVRHKVYLAATSEISMEVNPTSVEIKKLM